MQFFPLQEMLQRVNFQLMISTIFSVAFLPHAGCISFINMPLLQVALSGEW